MCTSPSLIRVLTVDDHALLREGIAALVNAESDMQLVAEASDGEEAIKQFRRHRPDVTLMDIQMPNLNGTEASTASGTNSQRQIIVLSTYSGDVQVLRPSERGLGDTS